jgi:hypothetical protein
MKGALLVLSLALAAGCKGKDIVAPATTTGTINFSIETKTCASEPAIDIEVFIDHVLVGTPTFTVGQTVSYEVSGGNHTIGGFAVDGRYNWGSQVVTVPVGGQYTATFGCHG